MVKSVTSRARFLDSRVAGNLVRRPFVLKVIEQPRPRRHFARFDHFRLEPACGVALGTLSFSSFLGLPIIPPFDPGLDVCKFTALPDPTFTRQHPCYDFRIRTGKT